MEEVKKSISWIDFSTDESSKEGYVVTSHYKEGGPTVVKESTTTESLTFDSCLEFLDSVEDDYVLVKSLDKLKLAIWHRGLNKDLREDQLNKLADFRKRKIVSFESLQGGRTIREVIFSNCFQWEDYNYPYGYSVTFTNGSFLRKRNVSLRECILIMRKASKDIPHKLHAIKEELENTIMDVYNHDINTRYRWRHDDINEVETAYSELPVFPYAFKGYYNHNTGHSFVKCYVWNTKDEDYTSEWWAGSGSCANGLIWIYQNDPDNYISSVEALREAIEDIYEEPYLSAALSDVDKAEEKVEKIKKSKPSRVDFSSVPVEEDYIDTNLYGDDCKIPTSGFYGDYYYNEFPEGDHVMFQCGQMKTTDYKDFEPFFRRFYEITNNKDYIISTLQDALSDFNNGYIKANSVNLCEKREIEYLLLVFNSKNLTPDLKTEVQVGITLKNNLTFKYKGEVIENDQVFFKIPVKERKRLWNYLLWFLGNLPPHKGSDWYGQLYPLYQWSMEDRFTSLSKYLYFKVDGYFSIRENPSYDGVWSFYTPSSNIVGKLTFSQQTLNLVKQNTNKIENWCGDDDNEINITNLYELHEFVLNNGEFYKLIDSLSKFKEIIDDNVFRKLPLIVNNPLNWAVPAGSFRIDTKDFKGYLEPITDSKAGYFRYRLRNCDPILGREKVDIKLIIDALPMEELLKAGDFKFDSGWSGTVGEHYWEKINSSEINKWLTSFDVNGKTDSLTFFLPDLLIKYRGWQILTKSKYKDEVNTVKLTKEETRGISAPSLKKLLNKKAKEIWMSKKIDLMLRSVEPDVENSNRVYLRHTGNTMFNNIKHSISSIKSLTKRFNFAKKVRDIMKNVIDGSDLYNETDDIMKNYYSYIGEVDKWWGCKQPSCDFSKRTIKYKNIVNGEIVEVEKVIPITPADRVRDIVNYKMNHDSITNIFSFVKEETKMFVLNLWHRYKFSWEVEKEFSETVEINGKKISVRKKPVKVSVPRYIEIPKEIVEGNPEVAFASGSLFYIVSSLLRLSSYTKTKELKERVVEEVDGFVRFRVDEGWMHKFLINRGAWILHDSNFADEEKIIHPRSSEVCCTLDDNKGWMDGDKLRFWWRAFSPAFVKKPVTLSFPSREVMRITE